MAFEMDSQAKLAELHAQQAMQETEMEQKLRALIREAEARGMATTPK